MSAEISFRDAFVEFGGDLIGFAPPALPQSYTDGYASWLKRGMHADMDYLAKRPATGIDCNDLLPGTQTVIVLAFNYKPSALPEKSGFDPAGRIARYATTRDYHKTAGSILTRAATFLEDEFGAQSRGFVDASPLMERAYAEQAGLGFVGKSGMLITAEYGTFVFLSTLLTTLELDTTVPTIIRDCGTCNACLKACPSGAIQGDGYVDSRKCLSYLTIENRGPIPEDQRKTVRDSVFGCDRCQQSCPHSLGSPPTESELFEQRITELVDLEDLLAIRSHDDFVTRFAGLPVMRAKWIGMLRNACVVAGNSRDPRLKPALERVIDEVDDPMILEHAKRALDQLEG
jgi:epoxyqueuosine reductase